MNRHERRKANKGKPKQPRILPQKSEVFRSPNLSNREVILDVVSMRRWAEKNLPLEMVPFNFEHIEWLMQGGTVDTSVLMNRTIIQGPKPIIICQSEVGGGDEIVDGNHTYVMAATAYHIAKSEGMSVPPGTPGYTLSPEQWRKFVVI